MNPLSISRAFKCLYYSVFRWERMVWFGVDDPSYHFAVTVIWFCQVLNLATLCMLLQLVTRLRLHEMRWLATSTLVVLWIVDYSILARKGKYLAILKEFEGIDPRERHRIDTMALLYVVGSWIGFCAALYFVIGSSQ